MAIWLDMASGSLCPWRWWCYGYAPDIDERSATLIRDPIVHIPHLSRLVTVGPQAGPTGRVHMVGCSNRSPPSHQQLSVVSGYYSIIS